MEFCPEGRIGQILWTPTEGEGPGLRKKGSRGYIHVHCLLPISGDTESGWDDTAVVNDLSSTSSGTESGPQSPLTPDGKRNPKGIKKFWGK